MLKTCHPLHPFIGSSQQQDPVAQLKHALVLLQHALVQIEFLQAQLQIVQSRLSARIAVTKEEKAKLLKLAQGLGPAASVPAHHRLDPHLRAARPPPAASPRSSPSRLNPSLAGRPPRRKSAKPSFVWPERTTGVTPASWANSRSWAWAKSAVRPLSTS